MDNPLAQAFGRLPANSLGASGVTLGNEQAQQDYASVLARALSDQKAASQQQALAESMMAPQYVQNSGGLGVLAMMMEAYAGKKIAKRAAADDADARERFYKGEAGGKAQQEARDAQRKQEESAAEMARREGILRSGDPYKIAAAGLTAPKQDGPEYDLREVGGKLYYVPKQPMGQQPAQPLNSPAADAGFDMLRAAVEWQESRGNPNAVSPKGARGRMQTMPGTLRDPGYGITPAADDSDAEMTRVGTEYLRTMTDKYGPIGGLAAYNWGPGNWERALWASGGDPAKALERAPKETRDYVPSVLQRMGGGVGMGYGLPEGAIPVAGIPDAPANRDAPSGYRFNGDGNLEPIPGGPADRKQNPVASDLAKGEMGMRKEVEDRVKQDRSILNMYGNIEGATKNGTAAGDLSAIFAFMKMLDPGSVVREAEFANAQNAAGIPDRVRNLYNQALKGNRLNDKQRAEFLGEARKLAGAAQDRITNVTREYQGIADQYGYDPKRATGQPDFRDVTNRGPTADPIDDLVRKWRAN